MLTLLLLHHLLLLLLLAHCIHLAALFVKLLLHPLLGHLLLPFLLLLLPLSPSLLFFPVRLRHSAYAENDAYAEKVYLLNSAFIFMPPQCND